MFHLQHEYRDGSGQSKKKKHKKDKDSDAEDDPNVTLLEPEKIENIKENETGTIVESSVDAVISSTNDDGVDDDQSERQNDQNSKKYVFSFTISFHFNSINLFFPSRFSIALLNSRQNTFSCKIH